MGSFHISRLASEILLFILLHLDLNQLVICRRINKQFQEVIDNNQLLWRIFEWMQQDQESFRPALDMFDDKSRSSIEELSIQERFSKDQDLLHLMQLLQRSKETLREIELKITEPSKIQGQVIELLATGSKMRSLVVWNWSSKANNTFPLSRLVPSRSRVQPSSVDQLQLLWVKDGVGNVDSKHLENLVSFALGEETSLQECGQLFRSFSETIIHLRLSVFDEIPVTGPLLCPNLKIFEGWATNGISSFFDAPQLRILVLEEVYHFDFKGFPPSVEEIWLRSRNEQLSDSKDWEPLLRLCPKLRILKLTERFVTGRYQRSFESNGMLEMLKSRKLMVQDGKEIDGTKIVSLEKLILPIQLISKEALDGASKVFEEVIDDNDYPEFIEIEY